MMKGAAAFALALCFAAPAALAWPLGGAPAPVVTATCGPDAAPAPAVAHGFTCEVFWDTFNDPALGTVDLNDTRSPTFKWFMTGGQLQVLPPTDLHYVAPGTEIGGMQLMLTTNFPIQNDATEYRGLWNMTSCVYTGGGAGTFVGTAVRGSMYISVQMSSIGNQAAGANWWPVVWMLSVQNLFGPSYTVPTLTPELDFFEKTGGGRNIHSWTYPAGTDVHQTYSDAPVITYPIPKTYGALILRPPDNGGVGTIRGYLDTAGNNIPVLDNSSNVTWSPGAEFSSTSEVPMCFLIGGGYQTPLTIHSIQVWQAPH